MGKTKSKICIGVMSGTSVDGIDVVISEFCLKNNLIKSKMLFFKHFNFTKGLREKILDAMNSQKFCSAKLCQLNFELAYAYSDAVNQTMLESGYKKKDIFAIGSHGQTIYHIPHGTKTGRKNLISSTLQIGDGSVIAEITGIATVSDFRTRDIAAGGEGAPLVPFADYHLFTHREKNIILQNIGGISNSTFLKANGKISDIIAFDNGPGNMMIDYVISKFTDNKMHFDPDGRMAAKGKVNPDIFKHLIRHPYFKEMPPKSTGREMFGKDYVEAIIKKFDIKKEDINNFAATLTALTAYTIADSYKKYILSKYEVNEIILSGGGAYNKTLKSMISDYIQDIPVITLDDTGLIISQAREALSFALLAYAAMLGIPNNIPSATGAKKQVVLGKISY